MDLQKYEVLSPILHNGRRFEVGEWIELTADQATRLEGFRAIRLEVIGELMEVDGVAEGELISGFVDHVDNSPLSSSEGSSEQGEGKKPGSRKK
jgi:hypothetical protein